MRFLVFQQADHKILKIFCSYLNEFLSNILTNNLSPPTLQKKKAKHIDSAPKPKWSATQVWEPEDQTQDFLINKIKNKIKKAFKIKFEWLKWVPPTPQDRRRLVVKWETKRN